MEVKKKYKSPRVQKLKNLKRSSNELQHKVHVAASVGDSGEQIDQLKIKKKKFGKPVIISSKPNELSSSVPDLFLQDNSCEISQDTSYTLSSLIDKSSNNSSSVITVGQTIVPDSVVIAKSSPQKKTESSENGCSIADTSLPERTESSNDSTDIQKSFSDENVELPTEDDSTDENEGNHVENDWEILPNNSVSDNEASPSMDKSFAPRFYSLSTKVVCILQPPCKFYFEGKLKVQVLYGAVEIYGSRLDKSRTDPPVEVFSSRESSAVCIETSCLAQTAENSSSILDALTTENIQNVSNALQADLDNIQTGWAVLLLQNFENNLTRFLGMYSNHRLFPKLENNVNYSWTDKRRAEIILQAIIYRSAHTKQLLCFKNIKSTMDCILGDCSKQRILLAGGKDVGKSTSMRYIVNQQLEKSEAVIILDLDPGQTEFNVSSCLSINIVRTRLLGPNFTHLATPYFQYFLGSVDVMRCLRDYTTAVRRLVSQVNSYVRQHALPVVVNTMGFSKHIGWDLMRFIIKTVQPTDIIQLQSRVKQTNFSKSLAADTINDPLIGNPTRMIPNLTTKVQYQLHTVQTANVKRKSVEMWNITPKQKRDITLLAYLSEIVDEQSSFNCWNLQQSINAVTPYEIPFSAVKVSMGQPVSSQILAIMNGNVVALCGCNFNGEKAPSDDAYPQVLVRAPLSPCYGFGIVRGVDMDKRMLYINTPLPLSQLKYVNCLIGSMPVPSGLLQLNKPGTPYVGGECDVPTSRDPRRGHGQTPSQKH